MQLYSMEIKKRIMQLYFTEDKEADYVFCALANFISCRIKQRIMQLYFTEDKEVDYITLFH